MARIQIDNDIPLKLIKDVMAVTKLPRKAALIAISFAHPILSALPIPERCQRIGVNPSYFHECRYLYRQQIRLFLQDQATSILAECLPAISYKVVDKAIRDGSVSHARLAYEVDGALSRGYKGGDKVDDSKRLTINVLIAQHFQDKFQRNMIVEISNTTGRQEAIAVGEARDEEARQVIDVPSQLSPIDVSSEND